MSQIESLTNAIEVLVSMYLKKLTTFNYDEFLKTGVDPFKFIFNCKIWGIKETIKKEIEHKIEMYLENMIGDFHENYLGSSIHKQSNSKWKKILKGSIKGIDIINEELNIYLQIKNKHNSMNSSSSSKLKDELEIIKNENKNVGCGWVLAGPKKKCNGEKQIDKIGIILKGNELYKFVTGNNNELEDVLEEFPIILNEVIKKYDFDFIIDDISNNIYNELEKNASMQQISIEKYLLKNIIT